MNSRGRQCPTCGGYAIEEPGGLRCIAGGHMFPYRRILPRDHWLSGSDRANRERQLALDRTFVSSGRMREFLFEMLENLERRRQPREPAPTEAPAPA